MDNSKKYFDPLLNDLLKLDFHLLPQIKEIEKKILQGTANFHNDLTGLTAYLLCKIMLGEKDKACDVARKIWDIGGNINPKDEALYIDCLINLGLKDMAEILLKPRYENIDENIEMFADVLKKFALQQGDVLRLRKILALNHKNDYAAELYEILQTYRQLDCEDDFSNVMKIIFEHSHKQALAYEFVFYSDRGFAEVEVVVYTNHDVDKGNNFENSINQKIDAYYASVNRERLNNIFVSVLMTSEHYSINEQKKQNIEEKQQISAYTPADWGF